MPPPEIGVAVSTTKTSRTLDRRRPPNFLVILADDLGIDALQQYQAHMIAEGGFPSGPSMRYPLTSTLAHLVSDGVRFFNFRTQPNCSPTRACVMSSRYPFRTGIGSVVREANFDTTRDAWEFGINHLTDEMTIFSTAVPAGYKGLICGKWHLAAPDGGTVPDGIPWQGTVPTGVELGTGWGHIPLLLGASSAHIDYRVSFSNLDIPPLPPTSGSTQPGYYNFYWNENGTISNVVNKHHTQHSRERLTDWISEQRQPWIAYWALAAIHSPFGDSPANGGGNSGCMPPDDGTTNNARSTYYPLGSYPVHNSVQACIEHMDYQIGLVRTEMGDEWDNNTVVIFMGDNGTQGNVVTDMIQFHEDTTASNFTGAYAALNGTDNFKGTTHEAGIRAPLLIRGPDWLVKNKNRTYLGLVDAVDIGATIRQLARVAYTDAVPDARDYDGISFVPALTSSANLNWEGSRQFAFSEIFKPLGDPVRATDTALGHQRDRSYILRIVGSGVYKVDRRRVGTSNVDTFHRLSDDAYVFDDTYQQVALTATSANPLYVTCTQALNALLQTQEESIDP